MIFEGKKYWLVIIFSLILIGMLFYKFTETERVSDQFSNNLFKYPIPAETVIIEKNRFNGKNWIDGGGSGGYWNVVAFMKMTSNLSREEILNYYKNTQLFPYPKSNEVGVELELYFEDDLRLEQYTEGSYYRSKKGTIKFISSYFDKSEEILSLQGEMKTNSKKTNFVIQIHSGFSYFMQID